MEICNFTEEHYSSLKEYWEQYGWVAPSLEVLPRKGFVAMKDNKVVAAAFVYMSCSGMAYMDWVIGDKNAEPLTRGKAVYKLVNECKEYAKLQGKAVVFTVTANQPLIETYKKIGFQVMESNATTLAIATDGTKLDFLKE